MKTTFKLPISPLLNNSSAVVRSHHAIVPLQWPVNRKRLGLDPIRVQEPSHSWTQNAVIVKLSNDFITQTRSPFEASRINNLSASGTTFWQITCSSSCSPKGPLNVWEIFKLKSLETNIKLKWQYIYKSFPAM